MLKFVKKLTYIKLKFVIEYVVYLVKSIFALKMK